MKTPGDGESLDEDSEFTLASNIGIGHLFQEWTVPLAVLYFKGETIRDDNFEDKEEEKELEDNEEGEDKDGEDEDDAKIN